MDYYHDTTGRPFGLLAVLRRFLQLLGELWTVLLGQRPELDLQFSPGAVGVRGAAGDQHADLGQRLLVLLVETVGLRLAFPGELQSSVNTRHARMVNLNILHLLSWHVGRRRSRPERSASSRH